MDDTREKGKSPKKKYNLRDRKKKKKPKHKAVEESDDSDSDWIPDEAILASDASTSDDDDSSAGEEEEEENGEDESFDAREYQKFIQRIFPSKAGKERMRQLEKIDALLEKRKAEKSKKKKKKKTKNTGKKRNRGPGKHNAKAEKSEDEASLGDFVLSDEEEEMDEDELKDMLGQNMKFNIIFTVGDNRHNAGDYDADEDDSEEEGDEDASAALAEGLVKGARVEMQLPEWDEPYTGKIVAVNKKGRYTIRFDDDTFEDSKNVRAKHLKVIEAEDTDDASLLAELEVLAEIRKRKGRKAFLKKFDELSQAKEKKDKQAKRRRDAKEKVANVRKFRSLLREKNVMNDFKYFRSLDCQGQGKIIKELKRVNKCLRVEKPYRLSLLEAKMPPAFKACALAKINTLNYMDPGSGEYYKIKQWVDAFMRVPFGVTRRLPVSIADGTDKCSAFMEDAKATLDKAAFGLEDAKMQIMQYVGQIISNPDAIGSAVAIHGPMGTGKTTLIKEGISKILKRPFAFLALGGATDSSFLEGHSYTYEGSLWGKVVDIVMQSGCMNPVIYFDELDKVSDTPKGEEIIGILTHLTDTSQNDKYHDKYFANIDFDLSKALFIFSYNDESKINPILRDRMYRITTKGYNSKEKITIAKDYLIPKIEKNVNFEPGQILVEDATLTDIINRFTDGEKGVRNLKRCLEIIYTKLNLHRLMKAGSTLFEKEEVMKVEFPFTVTPERLGKLVKKGDTSTVPFGMYM
jgi:hypothetical protein